MTSSQRLYGDWIERFREEWRGGDFDQLGPLCGPFVLEATEEFQVARGRILFVGQETNGWYSVSDFLDPSKGLSEAALWYREFDFAEEHPASRSPFWRFHRKLAHDLGLHRRALLWSNLVRFDGKQLAECDASIVGQPFETALLTLQRGILTREIEHLGIGTVIFVTGPDYDHVIRNEFEDVAFATVVGWQDRQMAEVKIGALPSVRMIRTYHPAYLQRAALFDRAADQITRFCQRS